MGSLKVTWIPPQGLHLKGVNPLQKAILGLKHRLRRKVWIRSGYGYKINMFYHRKLV